jgi:uncharacterized protein YbjQ (UPF0145 family)
LFLPECEAFGRYRLDVRVSGAISRGADVAGKEFDVDHRLVTTAFDIPGYKIQRTLGVVRGITVRSRSIFGNIGASIQSLFGGNITLYTELCEAARSEAYTLMIQHAELMGANALIGVRYDAAEVAGGISTEVLCYGTGVVLEPV